MKIGTIKRVQHEELVADRCPSCGKVTEMKVQFIQEALVLGLPLFPTGKSSKVICTSCNMELPFSQVPKYAINKYAAVRPTLKTPVWSYAFAVVIGVLLLIVTIQAPFKERELNAQIDKTKAGDIYQIRYENNSRLFNKTRYTMWKVVGVSDGNVSFVKCTEDVGDIRDVSDLKKIPLDERWVLDTVTYTKTTLKKYTDAFHTGEGDEIREIEQ